MTNDMIFDVQYTLVDSFTIELYRRLVIVMIPKQENCKQINFFFQFLMLLDFFLMSSILVNFRVIKSSYYKIHWKVLKILKKPFKYKLTFWKTLNAN